jgi:type IV secretion system protein VirB10
MRYPLAENPGDNAIQTDKKKREYQSLFASNLALSYRKETVTPDITTASALALAKPMSLSYPYAVSIDPSGFMQPIPAVASTQPGLPQTGIVQSTPAAGSKTPGTEVREPTGGPRDAKGRERDAALDRAERKRYRLFEGTFFETVLTNRLDGSFSGPVNCMVTTNVYSHNGQHVLIPQGSRVLGEVHRVETFGQQRLAVAFHRLIMPDGYSASLDQFHGLNQIGETGLQDQVNHHYMQVFGVSLAIGAIAGLSQANTSYGLDASALDAYRQGVSSSLSQSSMRILDRYLNVLPTFTIREGHRVKIYLSDDLLLPSYDQHQMPGDL